MSEYAVFFDPSRKRWGWIKRIGTVLGLLCVIVVSVFLLSIFTAPWLPDMPGITSAIRRTLRTSVHLPHRQTKLLQFRAKRSREKLLAEIAREQKQKALQKKLTAHKGPGIVAAFYAPWQETGLHSLRANASKMTHLLPAWVHLGSDGGSLDLHDWDIQLTPHNGDVLDIARSNNLAILPVFSNAELSDFDPVRAHLLLTNPELQDRVIRQLRAFVVANHFQGINVDLENLQHGDHVLVAPFLERLRAAFAPSHLIVSMDLEASAPLDWKTISSVCDFVIVMAYDEHSTSSAPGPIASMDWYRRTVRRAARQIPAEKLVIGLANYGYDWTEGEKEAEPLTYQEALVRARDYRPDDPVEKLIDFDPTALNPTYWYVDDAGNDHEVWMLDAVTAANQWMLARTYSPRGVAVWVLGSSDPSIWNYLSRARLYSPPNVSRALSIPEYPYDVEFIGEGEILHVRTGGDKGLRTLEIDPQTGFVTDEVYHKLPMSTIIERSGYHPRMVALTIDDGPAEGYSTQILDQLKALNVKATFFLIGQNAERYPGLVRRMWREGHEIGNHSYTHPNIGAVSAERARGEINATQRVIQSLLGRSTLLFRPPYNADAEPTSKEEVTPVQIASDQKYIVVGEYIDPQDWNTEERMPDGSIKHRTAEEMLQTTLEQLKIEKGSCILLHDGGGDRSQTVRLIPMLVKELQKDGYQFVTVSQLVGRTREEVNPPVKNTESFMLVSDRIVFEVLYVLELFLTIAFMSGIALGAARVAFVTILALIAKRREKHETFDASFKPSVSVVIAAFNEEKVILRTVEAVLASNYPDLEVVIVDDGSKDDTSGEVLRHFGGRQNVRLFHQENGGKASALNHGIRESRGDIIVALDADTLFLPDTIEKLVRRFEDPEVGAVAGNVKVGNRMNPLTYWQAIEYVTSQNLDRRAYAAINSVSVVPGAVGAWRRAAIVQAGGYTTDTMAEDMDLTWRIRQNGWQVATDSAAIGYTEAPDTFRMLFRQRFRWAFGTLQSLWKHRRALGRYGWFGRVMLPSLWLFQVVYQALSPLVDLQIAWTLFTVIEALARGRLTHDWQPLPAALNSLYLVAFMYAFFFVVELIGAAIAFKLDREDGRMLLWLFWQRFLYRQLMYAVLLKSLKTAISGMRAGWGKLERKGTVEVHGPPASAGVTPG
ncbi:MAG TPA: glycosyltransferase [Thermoanaerobaculia bacterium]|nr:glycosyltransferase [Thermoanaerobaculia bacterium]